MFSAPPLGWIALPPMAKRSAPTLSSVYNILSFHFLLSHCLHKAWRMKERNNRPIRVCLDWRSCTTRHLVFPLATLPRASFHYRKGLCAIRPSNLDIFATQPGKSLHLASGISAVSLYFLRSRASWNFRWLSQGPRKKPTDRYFLRNRSAIAKMTVVSSVYLSW